MGRKKLKYKDVVKGRGQNAPKNKQKKGNKPPRKTYSLFKKDHVKTKRKFNKQEFEEPESKKQRIEEKQEELPEKSESESEEEEEDPLQQLRSTFGDNLEKKKYSAIDSESETDEENLENEETNEQSADESNGDDSSEDISDEETEENDHVADESEHEIDIETEKQEEDLENSKDPFVRHIAYDLHESLLKSVENIQPNVETYTKSWPNLGNLVIHIPKCEEFSNEQTNLINEKILYAPPGQIPKINEIKKNSPENVFIKSQIVKNLHKANKSLLEGKKEFLTTFQNELFSIVNNYQDLYYPERNFDNADAIRFVYCLHAVNHILKTRIKVIHHNAKLSKKNDVPEEFRDQGLVRPKVLIVVPFKDSAYKIIQTIINIILPEDKGNIINRNRFQEEYTGNELYLPKKNPKPEDYEQTFTGNTGDDFKIGISVTKKSLKLYADFYSSDIIIASPLGLRTIIGAEGEPERDFDFLASIELLIFDQMEIFIVQNWDHIMHIFNHLHLKPKDLHGTDVSRVRQWSLNFWAKYYRQTLIFSSVVLPEINSIFNKKCHNYAGKIKIANPVNGCISKVFVQLPHVFHRFETQNPSQAIDARFEFFTNKIVPQQRDTLMKQTLVFVPSYFDYVKIRNYFKKEDINFVQICEYTKDAKVARARDMFFHGDGHFMLYTERYHYFNRIRVKGIRHLVFYQLPNFPHFYHELCNLMQESNMNKKVGNNTNMTVTVIYSKYDVLQLAAIVGTERASKMVQSDRKVHMMVTGAD